MCKALYIYTLGVGAEDVIDMAPIQFVLVFILAISQVSVCILSGSINEEDITGGTVLLKHQNTCRDRGSVEQVRRKTNYSVQQIFLNDRLTDTTLGRATEQNAVRDNCCHTTVAAQRVKHMQ